MSLEVPRNDLDLRFDHHPPVTEVRVNQHEQVRSEFKRVARVMKDLLPGGREAAVVQTKIEEAMFWANAALARTPEK
jgi:hypothetical protein